MANSQNNRLRASYARPFTYSNGEYKPCVYAKRAFWRGTLHLEDSSLRVLISKDWSKAQLPDKVYNVERPEETHERYRGYFKVGDTRVALFEQKKGNDRFVSLLPETVQEISDEPQI
jgi:hypothetical protein